MKTFLTYDAVTGEITGRLMVSDGQEQNYPHRIDISLQEYHAKPELVMKIDTQNKSMQALTPEEITQRVAGGVTVEQAQEVLDNFNKAVKTD